MDTVSDSTFSPQFMRTQMTSASKRNRLGRPSTPPQDVAVWIVSVTRKLVPMPYTMATKERMMTVTTIVIIGETVTHWLFRCVFKDRANPGMIPESWSWHSFSDGASSFQGMLPTLSCTAHITVHYQSSPSYSEKLVDDVMSQLQSSRGIIDSLWKSSSSARGVLDSRTLGSTVMMRCCDRVSLSKFDILFIVFTVVSTHCLVAFQGLVGIIASSLLLLTMPWTTTN
ncbi:hypothetical protein ABKN59_010955 [Abortiporus biennis]